MEGPQAGRQTPPDEMDQLLTNLFDQAQESLSQVDLLTSVMAAIRRRQRRRIVLLFAAAAIAVSICVVNGLPLLGLLVETLLSESIKLENWLVALPGLMTPGLIMGVAILLGIGCLHLLLEDTV